MLFAAGFIYRNLQWKYYLPAPALLSIQEAAIFVIVEGKQLGPFQACNLQGQRKHMYSVPLSWSSLRQ